MKLVILGGSGFVGKAICREAVRRGWQVTSLSRHGAPPIKDELLQSVTWRAGDALDPSIYDDLLRGQDYLVHSIGILFEQSRGTSYDRSYRGLIRDTAELAIMGARKAGIQAMGYISAARMGILGGMLLPQYMAMKEEAEKLLMHPNSSDTEDDKQRLRIVISRPGGIYGRDRWITIPISWMIWLTSLFTAGLIPPMVPIESVACTLLDALSKADAPLCQILENDEIYSKYHSTK